MTAEEKQKMEEEAAEKRAAARQARREENSRKLKEERAAAAQNKSIDPTESVETRISTLPNGERPPEDIVQAMMRIEKAKVSAKDPKKSDETHLTAARMRELVAQRAQNKMRGVSEATLQDAHATAEEIGRYIQFALSVEIMPTMESLAIWLGTDIKTIKNYQSSGTDTSKVLDRFATYIVDYHMQSGLASSSNPAFPIYFSKAVLGYSDKDDKPAITVNINGGGNGYISAKQTKEIIELTPTEWSEDS